MTDRLNRRTLLTAAAAAAVLPHTAHSRQTEKEEEVRLEHHLPAEINAAQAKCPTIFQPLGTIEWHGLHSPVGVDSLKAHALCVRAAQKGGGLVAPPIYGGVGGVKQPHTFVMDEEENVFSKLLRPWLEQLCREMLRNGFKAIIMLTGHYGAAQQIVVRETAVRMSRALNIPILGTPEYWLALDEDYNGDHAAWGETSLMMHLYPDSIDLSRLGKPPHKGVGGRDPKANASARDGKKLTDTIVTRLATLAKQMPTWNQKTLDSFIDSESTLVARQLSLAGQNKNVWAAWKNITEMKDYGKHLANEDFVRIKSDIRKL